MCTRLDLSAFEGVMVLDLTPRESGKVHAEGCAWSGTCVINSESLYENRAEIIQLRKGSAV